MGDTLRVVATGAFESVVVDLARSFERETGHAIALTFGNAGKVAARVEAGEAFGLVMTSSAGIDSLVARGRVIDGSKVAIGDMRLGVAIKRGAPAPDLGDAERVRAALAGATVALIDPAGGGTAGAHIVKILEQLGIADRVMAGAVKCATGHAVVHAVADGPSTLGLTQASEIIGSDSVGFGGFLPDELQVLTRYCAGLPVGGAGERLARAFVGYLVGPVGTQRLRAAGWLTPSP